MYQFRAQYPNYVCSCLRLTYCIQQHTFCWFSNSLAVRRWQKAGAFLAGSPSIDWHMWQYRWDDSYLRGWAAASWLQVPAGRSPNNWASCCCLRSPWCLLTPCRCWRELETREGEKDVKVEQGGLYNWHFFAISFAECDSSCCSTHSNSETLAVKTKETARPRHASCLAPVTSVSISSQELTELKYQHKLTSILSVKGRVQKEALRTFHHTAVALRGTYGKLYKPRIQIRNLISSPGTPELMKTDRSPPVTRGTTKTLGSDSDFRHLQKK